MATTWPGFFLESFPEEIRHPKASLDAECSPTRNCNNPPKDRPGDDGELMAPENSMGDSPFLIFKTTVMPSTLRMFSSFVAKSGGMAANAEKFDQELWKKNALIIELYVIGFLVAAGAFGNVLSLVVLKRDRQRRESLFLLRVLAVADLFYLVFATLRYPAKYLLPWVDLDSEGVGVDRSSPVYVSMQPIVFPCLKTTQTVTIWMTVLVAIDRFVWVRFPQSALRRFNAATRKRYALLVCLIALLYNTPRFLDSKVFHLNLPCFSSVQSTRLLPSSGRNTTPFRNARISGREVPETDWVNACLDLKNFELNLSAIVEENVDECSSSSSGGGWKDAFGQTKRLPQDNNNNNRQTDDETDTSTFPLRFFREKDYYEDGIVTSSEQYTGTSTDVIVAMTTDAVMTVTDRRVSNASNRIESERVTSPANPISMRCLRRTIMTYRLAFSGPIYHNVYLDGMYLLFLYLLPLLSITCINVYLVHAIRKSRIQRYHQCYYASFKFANNNKTNGNCRSHGDRCHVDDAKKTNNDDDDDDEDYANGDVIPATPLNGRHCRFSVWQTLPAEERRNDKRATCSCSSLLYSHNHNHNYLQQQQQQQPQQFQQHSLNQKNPHLNHQQCHCYHGNHGGKRRKEALRSLRSERADDARGDIRRQVTFNVKKDSEQQTCDACQPVTVWIPFRGSRQPAVSAVRPAVRLSGSELNATVVLVVVVAVFVACESLELVIRFMTFGQRNFGFRLLNGERLAGLTLASELSMVLKSTLNFLIYVTFGRRFRSFLKKVCPIRFPVLSSTSFGSSPQQKQAAPQII